MSISEDLSQPRINKWLLHFFFINLIVIYVLCYNYIADAFAVKLFYFGKDGFHEANTVNHLILSLYLIVTYISYFSILTIFALLIPYLISKVTSRNWITIGISILCISCFILFIVIDLYVFKLYRFHLNTLILKMLFSPYRYQIFYFSASEWAMFYLIVASILLIEGLMALFLWFNHVVNFSKWIIRFIYASIILIVVSFCSTVVGNKYLIRQSTIFPYYTDVVRHLFSVSKQDMNFFVYSHYFAQSKFANHQMVYPTHPLQCSKEVKAPNIFIILIDTWRFDAMNEKATPNIARFASENLNFHNHFSGGNATQPGVFSLFYSMPASYWTAIFEQKKSPEFINQLQKQNYQFGIYASASLTIPDFASTIFRNLSLPPPPSGWAYQRDEAVTKRFLAFLNNRKTDKPVFSFVFYDAAHEYCGKRNFKGPFQPETQVCKRYFLNNGYNGVPLVNRYLNAVNFVDQQVAQVLDGIKKSNLWDNSIIIISADHGEEFNDNHNGYWGHASNFSKYQIEVPFIVHWPGKSKQQFDYVTSHYDVVPTLMSDALGCKTAYSDYSYGSNLFDAKNRYPLIVSGNYNISYITPQTITNLFPSGDFEIQDLRAEPLANHHFDNKQLISILKSVNHFYH
ncbi:sulfatase [Legionella nautarum]|uniref:Sulfatase n=1 Tax=Legionella nautarum TaxID=45070 RepID=A0A0W0WVG8_9GAMM|nr:sulfatase-like hydrolase/transferase [Legionella nautarum]KTD36309.1 sulfatase [Legionella nautarum]